VKCGGDSESDSEIGASRLQHDPQLGVGPLCPHMPERSQQLWAAVALEVLADEQEARPEVVPLDLAENRLEAWSGTDGDDLLPGCP